MQEIVLRDDERQREAPAGQPQRQHTTTRTADVRRLGEDTAALEQQADNCHTVRLRALFALSMTMALSRTCLAYSGGGVSARTPTEETSPSARARDDTVIDEHAQRRDCHGCAAERTGGSTRPRPAQGARDDTFIDEHAQRIAMAQPNARAAQRERAHTRAEDLAQRRARATTPSSTARATHSQAGSWTAACASMLARLDGENDVAVGEDRGDTVKSASGTTMLLLQRIVLSSIADARYSPKLTWLLGSAFMLRLVSVVPRQDPPRT
ncbi:hypothetical protein GGX14DRAFT_572899 [Mycena pura]|uniref:Uncharacterized protein n=1 Tax=Mycena pura TaxID=153505 RepID=A0AAD6Y8A8_9AGAR|nr:hypothetical protein GGX14DRAFT_572899 [Mycena pura]